MRPRLPNGVSTASNAYEPTTSRVIDYLEFLSLNVGLKERVSTFVLRTLCFVLWNLQSVISAHCSLLTAHLPTAYFPSAWDPQASSGFPRLARARNSLGNQLPTATDNRQLSTQIAFSSNPSSYL